MSEKTSAMHYKPLASILKIKYLHSGGFISAHLVQILHFKHHSGIHSGGERKSSDHDPSTVRVSKIQPFACLMKQQKQMCRYVCDQKNSVVKDLWSNLSSTHGEEASSTGFRVVHLVIVTINNLTEKHRAV